MINVCGHPLAARHISLAGAKPVEQCSKCKQVILPVIAEPDGVGDWVPEVYTGHLQVHYAGKPHEAKTPPTMTMVNENYFEREFENLRAQAREIQARLNRLSREFYSVLHRERIERRQAECHHDKTCAVYSPRLIRRKCMECGDILT